MLHNKENKEVLKRKLFAETFQRKTLSFYRYVSIPDPQSFRDRLFMDFSALQIFGRIYVAHEGINAQMSVPEHHWQDFLAYLENDGFLRGVPLKIALEDDGKSFYKLIVRLKKMIVADGLPAESYAVSDVGRHLSAREWNEAMEDPNTVIVDMRNHYESEIGHFEGALCPDADTFKEALQMAKDLLGEQKKKKVLLYCTGGIRCEKASSYLKHHGFQDVNQLYGGIIEYAREVKRKNLSCHFKGKNFVFDDRRGERVTSDILSSCHQCGQPCDTHVNCANDACHLLFIQCDVCREKYSGCCTPDCRDFLELPLEEQKRLRQGQNSSPGVYKSRLRPKLREILREGNENHSTASK